MRNKISLLVFTFLILVIIGSCKKKSSDNPYDDPALKAPATVSNDPVLDANSFAYLYKNVFKPTCANSSCHDGTFEPDFRTMSGAYNTLVYQPVISNDASYSYTYRVLPGNSSMSLLWKRLTQNPYNLIGQGRMPWNDKTWIDKSQNATYIQNIVNWINAGAKDMFGNVPTTGNQNPKTVGLMVFPAGNVTSAYARSGDDKTPIDVPANTTVDIWISISDDATSAQNMVVSDMKLSTKGFDFTKETAQTMSYSTPVSGNDMSGAPVSFTHKLASFNTAGYTSGTILFVRTYLRDANHSVDSEMPNDGSYENVIKYFTIKIN